MAQAKKKTGERPKLRLLRNPKEDAHNYAVYILDTFLEAAGEDEMAAYACTMALHELLNLVNDDYAPAWDSFSDAHLRAVRLYDDEAIPSSVHRRAMAIGVITPPKDRRVSRN